MTSMQASWAAAPPPLTVLSDDAAVLPPGVLPSGARQVADEPDPGLLILTCANCGAAMDERKCRLVCTCGYFLSCSDYY
jgi:hypothetical protein